VKKKNTGEEVRCENISFQRDQFPERSRALSGVRREDMQGRTGRGNTASLVRGSAVVPCFLHGENTAADGGFGPAGTEVICAMKNLRSFFFCPDVVRAGCAGEMSLARRGEKIISKGGRDA